jgi:hypothetical protein
LSRVHPRSLPQLYGHSPRSLPLLRGHCLRSLPLLHGHSRRSLPLLHGHSRRSMPLRHGHSLRTALAVWRRLFVPAQRHAPLRLSAHRRSLRPPLRQRRRAEERLWSVITKMRRPAATPSPPGAHLLKPRGSVSRRVLPREFQLSRCRCCAVLSHLKRALWRFAVRPRPSLGRRPGRCADCRVRPSEPGGGRVRLPCFSRLP